MKQWLQDWIHSPIKRFLSWHWVKRFIYWLIISAGTISECAFLLASLWMSINSSVHPMILTLMSEERSIRISYIATTIFTALPELIVIMAVITTVNHCKNIRFQKRYWHTWLWAFLFGLPTVIFMTISLITVSCSVLKVSYVMPDWGIVARALSGYCFAVVYLLYEKLGEPCYADERKNLEIALTQKQEEMDKALQQKLEEIERITTHFQDALQTANSNFKITMQSKQSEYEYRINEVLEQGKNKIESLQNLLEARNAQMQKLSERASSLERNGLENYPKVISELLDQGAKTVLVDTLSELTGISKRKIGNAKLQRHSRNKDLIMVNNGLIEWLQKQPLPNQSNDQIIDYNDHENGHFETEEDPFEMSVLIARGIR